MGKKKKALLITTGEGWVRGGRGVPCEHRKKKYDEFKIAGKLFLVFILFDPFTWNVFINGPLFTTYIRI
jgi:hypothetical protein